MRTSELTIDRATVQRLARVTGDPVVTSVYLDIDGADRPVAATCIKAFEPLADEVRRRARTRQNAAVERSVERDLDDMRSWLAGGVDRAAARGLAMFSCHAAGWFEAIELPVAVRDEAAIGAGPRIRQLVSLSHDLEPSLVVLVDRAHLRVLEVRGREIEEHDSFATPPERVVDTSVELGSFGPRHDEAARRHLRHAAERVDARLRAGPRRRVVVGGPAEAVAELERRLHPTTRELIAGRVDVRVAAPARDVELATRRVVERAERQRKVVLVEQVRQRAAGGRGGVVGLDATLAMLGEHRVGTLLVSEGFTATGASCPSCGHVGPDVRQCAVCGTTNAEFADVVEVAIELAVSQGAEVEFCRDTELDRFGCIAAIERF